MAASSIQLLGTTGQRDKNGVISIVTRFLCPDISTAKNLLQTGGDAGSILKGAFTGSMSQDETGAFVVSISTDELTSSPTPQAEGGIAELDFSLTQEKIVSHPNFLKIAELYGWKENTSSFPQYMPIITNVNGTKRESKVLTPNPLYERDTYWAPGLIYMVTRALSTVPLEVLENIGAIDTPRKAQYGVQLPTSFVNRNWLKMAPQVSVRNNVVQIVEKWQLSPPGGWFEGVYGASSIKVVNHSSGMP